MTTHHDDVDPNKEILEFLAYYCQPDNPLDYAVMLRGPWGAGKTHLIDNFLKSREKAGPTKQLYVSLYGISTLRQIEDAFFR
jgi:hypothetical protein